MSIEREQYLRLVNKIYSDLHTTTFSINYWEKLKAIPSEISLLQHLEQLSVYKNKSIKVYPPELADLPNLRHLSLRYNYLKHLPKVIGDLKHLETLNLSNNRFLSSCKWEALAQLPKLKVLNLNYALQNFQELPSDIGKVTTLVELHIAGNKLQCLPNTIRHLQHLERLYCDANDFEGFPKVLAQLPRLKYLQIPAAALHDLPDEALALQQIEEVIFTAKSQKDTPYIFAFERLLKNIRMHNTPPLQQRLFLEIIRGDHAITDLSTEQLLHLLNCDIQEHMNQGLEELGERINRGRLGPYKVPQPLDKIVIKGKLNGKVSELKRRLQKQGFQTGVKLTSDTTYVVVGNMPGNLLPALQQGTLFLTEQQLVAHLNHLQKPYLLSSNKNEGVDQIRALLQSEQPENILLALELMKSGGFPATLLTELFLIYKFSKNQKIKRGIFALVGQYAPLDFLTALKSRKPIGTGVSEVTRCQNLVYYSELGNLDRCRIAFHLLKKGGYGQLFALFNLKTPNKKAYFSKLIQTGYLSLASLELTHLPDDFHFLSGLTQLDISYNKFTTVPPQLFQCTQLKSIYIRGLYDIHRAPNDLWKIPNLTTIYVGYNNKWIGNTSANSVLIDGKVVIGR